MNVEPILKCLEAAINALEQRARRTAILAALIAGAERIASSPHVKW